MTKIRLNKTHRAIITEYGQQVIEKLIERTAETAAYESLLAGVNAAIRKKYPEEDMVILRKHGLARFDRCIKMQMPTGRIDGFTFEYKDEKRLCDMPHKSGCYSSDVFAVDEATETAFDSYHAERKKTGEEKRKREAQLSALVESARTLDDVMEVIDLPAQVQERLGRKSQALVALSPDTLAQLKTDFKLAKAA